MATVYLETSIISYYTARPSRDLVVAARQEITRSAWPEIMREFAAYVSTIVLQEVGRGDTKAARRRQDVLRGVPVLRVTDAVESLAGDLMGASLIPRQHVEDAVHIAAAAAHGMDFLLTWNYAHINNARMEWRLREAIWARGYACPVICTPDELLGEQT